MRTSCANSQRGIALIVALLVVAIVATMALLFTERQQLWMRQLENRNSLTIATTIAYSAIDMARLTLRDDARNNKVDHLLEAWTIPIPPIAVEAGHIAGRLSEQQGHFNLTNLLPASNATVNEDTPALTRASRAFGIPAKDIANVLRAFQDVRKLEPNSAPELSELLRRASISPANGQILTEHATVLPEGTPINANFADAESLQAAIADLSSGEASALIARRTGNPFMSLSEFRSALPARLRNTLNEDAVSVQSSYFMVIVDAWYEQVHLGYEAMLRRDGANLPKVLWTRRSTLADS
ncbi:MAG: hypothetical protein H6R19_2191 [Proteobacteria bacterium]|nr:hypothetical protein [Pseudomonadota bacterium]